ncbi:MAG: 5'-nucleotidase, lipoprotein e(P4) family [Ginsengibacter sp.]
MKKIVLLILFLPIFQLSHAQHKSAKLSEEDLKLYPVLWQQSAAEYRALCYQAFNLATLRLEKIVTGNPSKKNLAIITDLDETILDNSELAGETIKEGKVLGSKWLKWVNNPEIPTVPGAVDFLDYAGKKGVSIFYISNRDTSGLNLTLGILQRLKLPNADLSHMLFLSNDFSKEGRRQTVMKDYDVVMLFGDNLDDFIQVFEEKSIKERFEATDSLKEEWGKKFIVLPNATYGEWENAFFNYKDNLTGAEKIAMLKKLLRGLDK